MEDIRRGARNYLTRHDSDPRQYAITFRNTLIFLVLEDPAQTMVPLAWALSARDDGWQNTSRSMNSGKARRLAEKAGLVPIEHGHPLHGDFWQSSLTDCLDLTRAHLSPHQQKFSDHFSRRREARDNSYYVFPETLTEPARISDPASAISGYDGAVRQVTGNRYERSTKLRSACVAHTRATHAGRLPCAVCDLDFCETYGPPGSGFIHIHHLDPLGDRQEAHLVDPSRDLVAVCPNCHAMLHQGGSCLSITELRDLLSAARRG